VGSKRTRNHPLPFNKENVVERNEHGLKISFSDVGNTGKRYSIGVRLILKAGFPPPSF